MNFIDWYNSEVVRIWKKFEGEYQLERMPLFLGTYKEDADVLIVGMNPSFNEEDMDKYFVSDNADPLLKGYTSKQLFQWAGFEERIANVKKWEIIARDEYKKYFGSFDEFIESCGFKKNSWAHIDLFLMRGTNQSEEIKLVVKKEKLNNFGQEQMDLLLEAINKNKHKIVIVFNATASKFISSAIGNNKFETNFLFKNKMYFFSGMLRGQRALDIFSRQRLIQEIRNFKNG